jgi:hypothetical protein
MNMPISIKKSSIGRGVQVIVLTTLSSVAFGESLTRTELVQQGGMDTVCHMQQYLSCLKISKSECQSALNKCTNVIPDIVHVNEIESYYDIFDDCMDDQLAVNPDLMDSCESAVNNGTFDYQDENAFSEQSDDMPIVVGGYNKEAESSIKQSGIPIYANSQMITSIDEVNARQMAPGDISPLPSAIYASQDDFKNVVSFYESNLNNYKSYQLDSNRHLFIKDGPNKFDMVNNYVDYFEKEHVLVEKISGELLMAPPGTKSKIEISYMQ